MSSSELRQMQGGVLSHSCRQPDSQLWLSAVRTYNANLSADGPKKLTERLTKNNVSAEGQQRAVSGSGALGSLCCVMQTGSEDKDQHSERGKDVKAWGGEKLRRHREKKKKARWGVISYITRSCMLICPAVCLFGCFHMTRFRKNYNLSKRIFVSYDSSMLQLKSRNTTTWLHTYTHTIAVHCKYIVTVRNYRGSHRHR